MPVIPANTGAFTFSSPGGGGSFRPRGALRQYGPPLRRNPVDWDTESTLAARLLVGFNVNDEPRWTLDDLVTLVRQIQQEQGKTAASFVAQRGLYQHKVSKEIVTEDSAQVLIIDTDQTPRAVFEAEMIALADRLVIALEQEEIIVDIQLNGITQKTMGVTTTEVAAARAAARAATKAY